MRTRLTKLCYILVLAAIAASMVLIAWLPPQLFHVWMRDNTPALMSFLKSYVVPAWSSYPQLFGLQTLAAVIFCCGAALWLCRSGGWRSSIASLKHQPFALLVAGYAAWAGLTWFWSAWPYGTRAYFIRELPLYVLAVAAAVTCARRERWRTAAVVFALSAAAEGLLQAYVIVSAAHEAGVTYQQAFLRNAVAYGNPNFGCAIQIAACLVIVALLVDLLRRTWAGERPRLRTLLPMAVLLPSLPVLVFLLIVSGSLAGKVAAVAAVSAYAFAVLPLPRKGTLVGIAAIAAAAVFVIVVASRPLRTKALRTLLSPRHTTSLRIVDWLAAKELYLRRPLQGWGMGTCPAVYARFQPPYARKLSFTSNRRTTHPHNEYVRVAADQGCIGLFLYLGMLGYAFVASWKRLKAEPRSVAVVGWALWAGALAFAVQAAFGKAAMHWSFSGPMWLLLGVVASAAHWPSLQEGGEGEAAQEADAAQEPGPAPLRCRIPAGVLLLLVCAAVGFLWFEWGIRAYDSALVTGRMLAIQKQKWSGEEGRRRFEEFRYRLEQARPRCLWPDDMLSGDYSTGWYLTEQGEWAEAAQVLEKFQKVAPETLRTRLFLAECYMGMGRLPDARREIREYLAHDPYDLSAYKVLAHLDGAAAAEAVLEKHVLSRLQQPEGWVIEDFPTAKELQLLLEMQLQLGMLQEARQTFLRARKFFAEAQVSRRVDRVDVDAAVRWLAQTYSEHARQPLAATLKRIMPEAWAGLPATGEGS